MFSERVPSKDGQNSLQNPDLPHPITMFSFFQPQKINLIAEDLVLPSQDKRVKPSQHKKNRDLYYKVDLNGYYEKYNDTLSRREHNEFFDNFYMPFKPYPYQVESVFQIANAIMRGKRTLMFESPTGTGKTQTILTSLLGYLQNKKITKKSRHKILYFTRTLSQMNQVIDEIKRSAYDVNATIVSSRISLCLNTKINNGNE